MTRRRCHWGATSPRVWRWRARVDVWAGPVFFVGFERYRDDDNEISYRLGAGLISARWHVLRVWTAAEHRAQQDAYFAGRTADLVDEIEDFLRNSGPEGVVS